VETDIHPDDSSSVGNALPRCSVTDPMLPYLPAFSRDQAGETQSLLSVDENAVKGHSYDLSRAGLLDLEALPETNAANDTKTDSCPLSGRDQTQAQAFGDRDHGSFTSSRSLFGGLLLQSYGTDSCL